VTLSAISKGAIAMMRWLRILLLIDFAALNAYALTAADLAELGVYLRNLGPWGLLATTDLLIALSIGLTWIWRDARAKGLTPWPFALLTLATESLGLLLYLARHDRPKEAREQR
jgi:hypothetical protein